MGNWTEKYRPQTLDEVILRGSTRRKLSNIIGHNGTLNLLFHGGYGVGKTTTARLIAQELAKGENWEFHEKLSEIDCNKTDTKKLDELVMGMEASGRNLYKRYQVWILDDFDQLHKNLQPKMKKLLEDQSQYNFVMLCVNDLSEVEDAILSRCVPISFETEPSDKEDFTAQWFARCQAILNENNISYDPDRLRQLILDNWDQGRQLIGTLQVECLGGELLAA
jgi:replication-associated recombination protein RarA